MLILRRFLSIKMSKKINYPSADRNKTFILEVLQRYIDPSRQGLKLLEISSGTGQHAAYFAQHLPLLKIQPSDVDESLFESIRAYARDVPSKNLNDPVKIDVTSESSLWGVDSECDYILNVNMFHVAPFSCSEGFFKNGSKVLKNDGLIFTYGPYAIDGVLEPASNVEFDRAIRMRNPEYGVRDIADLKRVAAAYNIKLIEMYDMPANNKCLVWKKGSENS